MATLSIVIPGLDPGIYMDGRVKPGPDEGWSDGRHAMATASSSGYRSGLVDLKTAEISREIFVNEAIYAEEQEKIFACPYHGWSYGTDGRLVGVPYFREAYHSSLDRSQWGLVEVAQLARYKGSVWATWDPAAPPFLEYLGDFTRYLDLQLDGWDGREAQAEVLCGIEKWRVPCNWKFPAENFSGDTYHNISHRSVDLAGIGPSGSGRRDMGERNVSRKLHVCIPDRGHQSILYVLPKDELPPPAYQHSPIVGDYFRHCEEEKRQRRGESAKLVGAPGEVFPNTALLSRQPRTMAVWHPRGPNQTECWRWFYVDRDAPREVKEFLRDYYIRYSGPAGMTEQDDMENWNYAHAASRGTIARRHPYNYDQGNGTAVRNYEYQGLRVPGEVIDITDVQSSEQPARNFYGRWAEFMEAPDWDALATWRRNSRAAAE